MYKSRFMCIIYIYLSYFIQVVGKISLLSDFFFKKLEKLGIYGVKLPTYVKIFLKHINWQIRWHLISVPGVTTVLA